MLSKIIKNIRSKSESTRKTITLSVSLGVTGVLAFFWFISFINYSSAILSLEPKGESPGSFLTKIGSLVGDSYANVKTRINPTTIVDTSVNVENPENYTSSSSTYSTASSSSNTSTTSYSSISSSSTSSSSLRSSSTSSSSYPKNSEDSPSLEDILNTKTQDNK
jgi:hypothetical protein